MDLEIAFDQIHFSEEPGFRDCMAIYHEAFPVYERQTDEVIIKRVNNGSCFLIAGRLDAKVVCMSILWEFENTPFMFLDYFAVANAARGHQVGTRFFDFIITKFLNTGTFMIMEVEHPDHGDNSAERTRRIQFYKRQGAVILENVSYFLPPLGGSETPLQMQLMSIPDPGDLMDHDTAQKLITMIYNKIYEKEYDNSKRL